MSHQETLSALEETWRTHRRSIDALLADEELQSAMFVTGFKSAYYHSTPEDPDAFNDMYQAAMQDMLTCYQEIQTRGHTLSELHLLRDHSELATSQAYPQDTAHLLRDLRHLLDRMETHATALRPYVPREHQPKMDGPFASLSTIATFLIEALEESNTAARRMNAAQSGNTSIGIKSGYKQTEVGMIPEDWTDDSVGGLIASGIIEKPLDGNHGNIHPKSADFVDYGIPFVMANNVQGGHVDMVNCAFIRREQADSLQKGFSTTGDVLLTHKATIGNTAIVGEISNDYIMLTPQVTYYRVSDPNRLSNHFLRYCFDGSGFQRVLKSLAGGGTRSYIGITAQHQLPVVYPPRVTEQLTIAESLGDVDGLLGALDRLIAKKRDLKQAAMQQLLTGQTRLPGFKGEWMVRRLGDFGKCHRGVSYNPETDLSTGDRDITIRLLRSNNVQNARIELNGLQFVAATKVSNLQRLRPNDVLICMANGSRDLVGKAGRFEISDAYAYTFGAFMGCFRPDDKKIDPALAFYQFHTKRYRNHIAILLAGSSINNLNPSSVEELEVEIPIDPAEQTAIAKVLSDMDAEISALEARREKTRSLKQGMMQELLTGRTRLV